MNTGHTEQLLGEYRPFGSAVQVWTASVPRTYEAELEGRTAELHPDEGAQAARIATRAARAQYVMGRSLARRVLARRLRVAASRVRFGSTAAGRPYLCEPRCPEIDFNLSHSGRLTALALTCEGRVGIDIEETTEKRDFEGIAAGFFSPSEYDRWSTAGAADRTALWYRTWTRREAFVKATGAGLRDIGGDHQGRGSAWTDIPFEPAPGLAGCLVLLRPSPPFTLREVNPYDR